MNQIVALTGLLLTPLAFANPPVLLSGPTPALASSYDPNSSSTVVYTITNNVPQILGLTVGGISGPVSRTSVANDCGHYLPKGPSTCNLGITLAPTDSEAGLTVNQTLEIGYGARVPLTTDISFQVSPLKGYVTSFGTPYPDAASVYYCDLILGGTQNGNFENCNLATTTRNDFIETAFATVNGTTYAYVAAGFSGEFYQCGLNNDGSFSACNPTPSSGAPSWAPFGIAFATFQGSQFCYVADISGNVYQCTLNSDGSLNTCTATPSSGSPFSQPLAITFASFQGTQYAYVADQDDKSIFQCTLNSDGSLNTCSATPSSGAPTWQPAGISFGTVQGTQYAYVSDENHGAVWWCTLNGDGTLNICQETPSSGAPFVYPQQISFATTQGIQYAYVADNLGEVYQCTLNGDGSFGTCTVVPTSGAPSWSPAGVAFN